jgi:hypothetical protein
MLFQEASQGLASLACQGFLIFPAPDPERIFA